MMQYTTTSYTDNRGALRPNVPVHVNWASPVYHEDGTVTVEILDRNWPPITYKSDVMRRSTDQEIETIDQVIESQSPRNRRLWNDSQFLSHVDPMFDMLVQMFTQYFGEERTHELLAASEQ